MKDSMVVIIGITLVAVAAVFSDYYPESAVYDCTLADTRADYPAEIEEECRRLLKEYEQKENRLQT